MTTKKRFTRILFRLAAALAVTIALPAGAAEPVPGYDTVKQKFTSLKTGRVSALAATPTPGGTLRVIFKAKRAAAEPVSSRTGVAALARIENRAQQQSARVKRKVARLNVISIQVTEAQFDALVKSGDIEKTSIDLAIRAQLTQSVPFIRGDLVHQVGWGGQNMAVAILDTGVEATHDLLGGRVVEEACFSSGDNVNSFSLCPNGQTTQFGPGAAQGCDRYPGVCAHGTHVAGIAAGKIGSIIGVAPEAKIIAVQVFQYFQDGGLYTYESDLMAAYDWLINTASTPNIASINMSIGGGDYTDNCNYTGLAALIDAERIRGTASVIAAGNSGSHNSVTWPGCVSSAVTVGAIERASDVIAGYSNISTGVDLLAPGSEIFSSTPHNSYSYYWGTSMATPHVTGAFATLKSARPGATVDQIESALKSTGVPVFDSISGLTLPRVDLYAAYQQLVSDNGGGSCVSIPGTVTASAGAFANGESKSWTVYARQGGLFRVWLTSTAAASSNSLQLTLGNQAVNLSVSAGQTILADFANLPAGTTTLKVTSLSNGLSLATVRIEQLNANGPIDTRGCVPPSIAIPGLVTASAGTLAQNEQRAWTLHTNATGNVRVFVTANTTQSSGTLTLSFNGAPVPLSFVSGQTAFADFANIATGDRALSVTANTPGVSVGKIETLLY